MQLYQQSAAKRQNREIFLPAWKAERPEVCGDKRNTDQGKINTFRANFGFCQHFGVESTPFKSALLVIKRSVCHGNYETKLGTPHPLFAKIAFIVRMLFFRWVSAPQGIRP